MKYPKFSKLAQQDLYEIAEYIAADNPDAANRVIDAIEITAMSIMDNTAIGKKVDSSLYEDLRYMPCTIFSSYQIYYRTQDEDLVIVRVLHGARNIHSLFE